MDSESDVTVFRNQSSHLRCTFSTFIFVLVQTSDHYTFRILTYLPAYLLFTNSLPPERDGIVNTLPAVAACLKRIMVYSLSNNVSYLTILYRYKLVMLSWTLDSLATFARSSIVLLFVFSTLAVMCALGGACSRENCQ